MGALKAYISITNDRGIPTKGISDIYIWREEQLNGVDDWYEYTASRTPPNNYTIETVEERTFVGAVNTVTYKSHNTPTVRFQHKYSDGAELCLARAILALQGAGLNV